MTQATYCVFDPIGTAGDYYAMAKDYQVAAQRWGVSLNLKSYTSETIAVEDFKAGQCDMMDMTGLRARLFNKFSGTIDAPGALEDYAEMRIAVGMLASPKLANYLIGGQFEVVGVLPVGAAYAFVKDKRMNTIAAFAGKKIGVMGWDPTESIIAEQFGAQPVLSDITDIGGRFNSGSVDCVVLPTIVYKAFELYKGLGDNGGIIRRAILQVSLQLVTRRDKFPPAFGQQSRDYMLTLVKQAFGVIRNSENAVDPHHWIYMNTTQRNDYYSSVRAARVRLAKEGFYDKRMLNLLKRVRCKSNPADAECSEGDE